MDYQLGEDIKEKIVPKAVDYFTGKALEYDMMEEDDDDDDDEDYEDIDEGDDDGLENVSSSPRNCVRFFPRLTTLPLHNHRTLTRMVLPPDQGRVGRVRAEELLRTLKTVNSSERAQPPLDCSWPALPFRSPHRFPLCLPYVLYPVCLWS